MSKCTDAFKAEIENLNYDTIEGFYTMQQWEEKLLEIAKKHLPTPQTHLDIMHQDNYFIGIDWASTSTQENS